MFSSVLIANRGEIAVRIAKTLRKMGIRSVVVASIPDRRSLAVRTADDWVLLEGYSAAESYLDVEAVIAAAKAKGCEAIHPGYGFLSERADFAERCAAEGITFIGPPPEVLRGLGDKAAARQLAVANGVPVVPGYDGPDHDETLVREAARIGFPVMLKARGGGGGRGMREVFALEDLPEAIESARREALAAFGDGGLLLEKLVTNAHHVEVQVLADTNGNVIHLGERDCSVQRRHQKLIEETPSPVVDDALRKRLTSYALTLARAINYVNAGTFEFLISPSPATNGSRERGPGGEGESAAEWDVFFLEVNPRLQVEHPVTEMVTGLDLVELQLRIAAGEPLPLGQEDVTFTGHAIEFRINAEDPWDGFKPSSGRIERFWNFSAGRVDSGFEEGDEVPGEYDSLLAKDIRHRPIREALFELLHDQPMLELVVSRGRTNLGLLDQIARSAEFQGGSCTTTWLETNFASLASAVTTPPHYFVAGAVFHLCKPSHSQVDGKLDAPMATFVGLDWLGAAAAEVWLDDGQRTVRVEIRRRADRTGIASVNAEELPFKVENGAAAVGEPANLFRVTYRPRTGTIAVWDSAPGSDGAFITPVPPPPLPRRAHAAAEGATAIAAPLAGTIAAVRVAEGDEVAEGQLLLVLEAMKMEHRITAPAAGTVKALPVRERDVVREGDVLVELG